jgi:hypothetical protein
VQGRRPRLSSELFEHRSAGDSALAGPLSIRLAPAPLKIDPPKIGRSDLSVKELPNAEIRLSSGRRYLALVPELFELSLAAGEDEKNQP